MTAVEWLVDKLDLNVFESNEEVADIIDQAKEMEKEQIIQTWYDCKMSVIEKNPTTADEYYNKTFKSE